MQGQIRFISLMSDLRGLWLCRTGFLLNIEEPTQWQSMFRFGAFRFTHSVAANCLPQSARLLPVASNILMRVAAQANPVHTGLSIVRGFAWRFLCFFPGHAYGLVYISVNLNDAAVGLLSRRTRV